MKSICSCVLIVMLVAGSAEAREVGAAERAHKIKRGSRIEAVMVTGEVANGRLGNVTDAQFELLPEKKGPGAARVVAFTDVRGLRSTERHVTRYVLIAAGVGFFIFVAYVGHHT